MHRGMFSTAAVAGLGLAVAVLVPSPAHAAPSGAAEPAAPTVPTPSQCRRIDFEKASVTPLVSAAVPPSVRYRLTVSGTRSATNVSVKLVPVVYDQQPEYWGIQVTGCSSGIGLTVLTSYTVTYDFTGPRGTCGVEVIGTTKRQQFDLAGCTPVSVVGTHWDLDPASLGVPVPAEARAGIDFSSATSLSGNTSCNSFGADYTLGADGSFDVGKLWMTARACADPLGTVERAFLHALTSANRLTRTSAELRLLDGDKTLMRLVPAQPA
ncbi:MAG: hypothetical protein QG622_1918 [Actinomycetota bacterium]|nr:hypothetical protein [Actinomycetota bacterium]